jgi:RHS repeat-associated protein
MDLISVTDKDGNQTYFLYDGLGSTTGLADGSGNVTTTYGYDVFGGLRSGSLGVTDSLLTGEPRDSESGLYYLRARFYDPAIGRFLSQDPLPGFVVEPQSLNRCVYAENNPRNWVVPSGLDSEGGRCNIAQALLGSLVVYAGLLLEVPGIYLAMVASQNCCKNETV